MNAKKVSAIALAAVIFLGTASTTLAAAPIFNSFHGGFRKTKTSVTLPVQYESKKGKKVTISIKYQEFYTKKGKTVRFTKTLDTQHGDTFVTVKGLAASTMYSFRIKVGNSAWSVSNKIDTEPVGSKY
ncbi:MAG TPA: fibronectin type III domain-containing protein [Patescibacteria group bacterium]